MWYFGQNESPSNTSSLAVGIGHQLAEEGAHFGFSYLHNLGEGVHDPRESLLVFPLILNQFFQDQ